MPLGLGEGARIIHLLLESIEGDGGAVQYYFVSNVYIPNGQCPSVSDFATKDRG
jgi:hypothetical protein